MTELAVIDAGCDDLAEKIRAGIDRYGGDSKSIRIRSAAFCAEILDGRPDILVLSEDALPSCGISSGVVRCGVLLLPGDVAAGGADARLFEADCLITYGMSPKNTITLSSISETSCVLAIQREFMTAGGDMLERQEIKIKGGMRPNCLLAVAGALLILGLRISDANP